MVSKRVQTLLEQLRAQGIANEQVLDALAQVPREKFVDEAFEHKAWENVALPIGQGQTISQPYMVARMTELLELTPDSRFRVSDRDPGPPCAPCLFRGTD